MYFIFVFVLGFGMWLRFLGGIVVVVGDKCVCLVFWGCGGRGEGED